MRRLPSLKPSQPHCSPHSVDTVASETSKTTQNKSSIQLCSHPSAGIWKGPSGPKTLWVKGSGEGTNTLGKGPPCSLPSQAWFHAWAGDTFTVCVQKVCFSLSSNRELPGGTTIWGARPFCQLRRRGDLACRHSFPHSDAVTETRDDPGPQGAIAAPSLVMVGVHILRSPRPLLQHNLYSEASGFVEILSGPACGVLTYSFGGQERQAVPRQAAAAAPGCHPRSLPGVWRISGCCSTASPHIPK